MHILYSSHSNTIEIRRNLWFSEMLFAPSEAFQVVEARVDNTSGGPYLKMDGKNASGILKPPIYAS